MRTGFRAATDEERKALGVPPAYTDVCVPIEKGGKLLAIARIPNGKTYYKYAKAETEKNARAKWKRIAKLGVKLEKIEARLEADIARDVGEAYTVRLILLTGMRNGNPPQGNDKDKPSYGASSLLMKHVQTYNDKLVFDFPGKHHVQQHIEIEDKVLAAYVWERCCQITGPHPGDAPLFLHSAGDTLRYLKKIGAEKVHDLRTLRGNVLANAIVDEVLKIGKPTSKKEFKAMLKFLGEQVGAALGNKPSQALKSYIDPSVIERLNPDAE